MLIKKSHKRVRLALLLAKLVSIVSRPVYYPLFCLLVLFHTTFLRWLDMGYVTFILGLTLLFTILLPWMLTKAYIRLFQTRKALLSHKSERLVPYVIHLLCFCALLHLMQRYRVHALVMDVILVSTLIQVCCILTNFFLKISTHAVAAGALLGSLLAYGIFLDRYTLFPLSCSILLCGVVGSSRLVLRRHKVSEIHLGTLLGVVCGFLGFLLSAWRIFWDKF